MDAIKAKVLKELIDVLDQEDGKLLMKHPKVVAAKVTMAKPIDPKMAEKMQEEMPEGEMEGEEEDGFGDVMEDVTELEELSPEMKAKMLKLLSK